MDESLLAAVLRRLLQSHAYTWLALLTPDNEGDERSDVYSLTVDGTIVISQEEREAVGRIYG